MNKAAKYLFGLVAGAMTVWTFFVPDAQHFQSPELARIFFFHFPCPMTSTMFMIAGAVFSLLYLVKRQRMWEVRAVAANEVGMTFGILTMATGIIFSKAQWGAWWQWDPRQTSFLLVLMIYLAYFLIRTGYADEQRRAAFGSAFAVAALLPNMFLIFVFPRLPQIANESFHPTNTIVNNQLDVYYKSTLWGMVAVMFTMAVWIYKLRARAELLEVEAEELDGKLGTMAMVGGGAAPTGVVRPVSVPDER